MPEANDMLYWAPSRILRRGNRYLLFPTLNKKIRVAAADSPEGPFHLIADSRERPLLDTIDAEVFVDDDGQGYLFSNHRQAWRMNEDLTGVVGEPITIPTRRSGYSEGPIVFKRLGVYYYLYTLSGHETYHYAYCISRQSPLGPFETPAVDIIAESDPEQGIFGPGHGTVFSPAGTDDHYFVYLEYGRGGVTRQVCMDRMEFHPDGTIKPVRLTTSGIPPFQRSSRQAASSRSQRMDQSTWPVARRLSRPLRVVGSRSTSEAFRIATVCYVAKTTLRPALSTHRTSHAGCLPMRMLTLGF